MLSKCKRRRVIKTCILVTYTAYMECVLARWKMNINHHYHSLNNKTLCMLPTKQPPQNSWAVGPTVQTMLYGRVTFLEFQCPLSVVYRWIKPNAFNQGKFGLKSVQKFIFEPSGLHSTGLVAFQSGKVTRACKVYGICLKLLLKLRLSFSQKETSHILSCWELWGFKVQQGRT